MWQINAFVNGRWLGVKYFQGYSRREAVSKYREMFGLKYKHVLVNVSWAR